MKRILKYALLIYCLCSMFCACSVQQQNMEGSQFPSPFNTTAPNQNTVPTFPEVPTVSTPSATDPSGTHPDRKWRPCANSIEEYLQWMEKLDIPEHVITHETLSQLNLGEFKSWGLQSYDASQSPHWYDFSYYGYSYLEPSGHYVDYYVTDPASYVLISEPERELPISAARGIFASVEPTQHLNFIYRDGIYYVYANGNPYAILIYFSDGTMFDISYDSRETGERYIPTSEVYDPSLFVSKLYSADDSVFHAVLEEIETVLGRSIDRTRPELNP